MSTRPRFDARYIESELETVGDRLEEPVRVYLIGGGSLALRGLKEATKDIDVVVDSSETHGRLYTSLLGMGYDEVDPLEAAYQELGATSCVENEDGCRIEIFDRQVVGKLVLSDGMKDRSETWLETGRITVDLVSPEDVFLFKAVATRPDDIGDMAVLVQTGLDFEVIDQELSVQIELLEELQFVTYVSEALGKLEEQHGTTLPLADRVDELSEMYYEALEVQMELDGPTPVEELQDELGIERGDLEVRIRTLERTGQVSYTDGVVRPR